VVKIQLKDNCWTCLGLKQDCVACNGSGEIITWITLEELTEQIEAIQIRKKEREMFFAPIEAPEEFNLKDLDMPPNVNI